MTTTIAYNFLNDLLLYLHFRYNVDDIDEFTSVDLVSQKTNCSFLEARSINISQLASSVHLLCASLISNTFCLVSELHNFGHFDVIFA